ncbi:MAG: type I methionyl aminopeptidase [Clostridia bacterium]|nr:type I methionyl aminopeptidase [Clostridia bacterium]
MIKLKTASDIRKMEKSGQIVAMALEAAKNTIAVGMTTQHLCSEVENAIRSQGAVPSFLGYHGYPAACCISINDEVVHGIPSKSRIICDGDIVSVDVGALYDGFHGDAARTFAVGSVSDEARRLIEVTEKCFFAGAQMARPGNHISDISLAVQTLAESEGYGVVRELVGHGIGQDMHEDPEVPNFKGVGRGVRLVKGMTIAVEPMINMGGKEVVFSQTDGWTVTTKDGSLSAHYENTMAITSEGPLILTVLR